MPKTVSLVLLICLTAFFSMDISAAPGAPTGLLCELLRAPDQALITDATPEFSWIVNDTARGARQSAYRIRVAATPAALAQGKGDMWDSGKVLSDRSINVEYAGKTLAPLSRYFWQVQTWSKESEAPGPFSKPQAFRTGRFQDVKRQWPAESQWVKMPDGEWFLENRQKADFQEISPRTIQSLDGNDYFIDFGKAAFATLRLRITSPKDGDALTVFLGERKTGENRVHKKPGKSNIGFKKTTIPLRKGTHEYTIQFPRHKSHYPHSQVLPKHIMEVAPFRYAEIVAPPSPITAADVRQLALFYHFDDEAARFRCNDDALNKVWDLCKYTLKATSFLSLYSDGNRERMPYEADAYIQQLGHYCVDREYTIQRYTHHFLIYHPAWPTEWHLHTILMAWADYMHTGNLDSIKRFYGDLKKKSHVALARPDGLISTKTGLATKPYLAGMHFKGKNFRDIVDWPAGERDGYVFKHYNTVVNAFHYRALVLMGRMAKAIGKMDDALFFTQRAAQVKASFNRAFFDAKRKIYVDGIGTGHASLHANMFPLALGLVPENRVPGVAAYIKKKGMACSVYGAQYLLEALFQAGEDKYALALMTSGDVRSWRNMLRVGSTMTTEAWDERYKPNLTWNHAWASAPANIIPGKLFGIEPLTPGFKLIQIKPQMAGLAEADLALPCIRGTIHCRWRKSAAAGKLSVKIPANTRAMIQLPATSREAVTESGKPLATQPGITILQLKDGRLTCEIGAGHYHFTILNP